MALINTTSRNVHHGYVSHEVCKCSWLLVAKGLIVTLGFTFYVCWSCINFGDVCFMTLNTFLVWTQNLISPFNYCWRCNSDLEINVLWAVVNWLHITTGRLKNRQTAVRQLVSSCCKWSMFVYIRMYSPICLMLLIKKGKWYILLETVMSFLHVCCI